MVKTESGLSEKMMALKKGIGLQCIDTGLPFIYEG
jgi:hypothetical protein